MEPNASATDNDTASESDTFYDYGDATVAVLSFFLLTSMVMALGGNIMVIMTIVRHRGMRTRTNMLLANLAVADILVAVLDMPIALITVIKRDWVFSDTFCVMNGFAVGLGLMLSIHTLMLISIHKFISITRPFARTVTPFQIMLMMVGAWTWTIIFNLTPTPVIGLTDTIYKKGASQCGPRIPKELSQLVHAGLNTTINFLVPLVVMFYCYYRIFKEVKDHLGRMQDFADVSVRNSFVQQKRITETLCIVLFMFLLFWSPYIAYSLSLVFSRDKNAIPLVFNPISYLCGYMNSACNPVIYALRSPSFRRGFKEIICRRHTHMPGGSLMSESVTHKRYRGVLVSFRRSLLKARRVRQESQAPPRALQPSRTLPLKSAQDAHQPDGKVTKLPEETELVQEVTTEGNKSPSIYIGGEASEDSEGEANGTLECTLPYSLTNRRTSEFLPLHLPPASPIATSHTDLSRLPWPPLAPQASMNGRLSRSQREIVTTTTTSMTKSASAGDIRLSAAAATPAPRECSDKRRHKSEVQRPLMWQASVDRLYDSPVIHKRKTSNLRRVGVKTRREVLLISPRQLRVTALFNNLKRSFSDLFHVDECPEMFPEHQGP